MKIENNGKVQVLDHLVKSANANNAKSQKQGGVGQTDNQGIVDKVELSTRKTEIEQLKEKVKAAPVTPEPSEEYPSAEDVDDPFGDDEQSALEV